MSTLWTRAEPTCHTRAAVCGVPQAYFATRDQKVKRRHVEMWRELCGDTFELEETRGNHLFFYDVPHRAAYMKRVIAGLPAGFGT